MNAGKIELTAHPLAEKFPNIPLKEFEELKKSILEVTHKRNTQNEH